MSVPYVNLLLVFSSTVLYVRDSHKETRSWLLLLLLPHAPGPMPSPQQHSTASWMVEHRAGAARSQKKTAESAWSGCVLITATQQRKHGNLEQNLVLLECCAQGVGRLFIFRVVLSQSYKKSCNPHLRESVMYLILCIYSFLCPI